MSYMPCDQGDEVAVELLDLARALLQHRVAEESQRIHAPKVPARPAGDRVIRRGGDRRRRGGGPRVRAGVDAGRGQRVAQRGDASGRARAPGTRRPTGPSTVTPAVGHRRRTPPPTASGVAAAARPARRTAGTRAPARRARSAPATTIGSPRRTARTTSWSGSRVCTSSRRRRVGRASRARAHEEPERLLGGPGPRRQQLLVELEERDQADGRRSRRRRGAAPPRCRRAPATSGTASVGASTAATSARGQQRGEVVAHAA